MAKINTKDIVGLGWDFLKEQSATGSKSWPRPLSFIAELPNVHKGDFGKFLVAKFCESSGLEVISCPRKNRSRYDWEVNGQRVSVRFAFEGEKGLWTFNQIRYPHPNTYDYLCCLGIYPTPNNNIDCKCFVFSKQEIDNWIEREIFPFQHPGKETWSWTIPSKVKPDHYSGNATIDELVDRLSK